MTRKTVVTEQFLRRFKPGDLVDVRIMRHQWSGPYRLLDYEIEPVTKGANPAARIEVELGEKKFERWLIVGDQQIIRKHIPQDPQQLT